LRSGVLGKYRRAGIAETLVLQVMEEGVSRGFKGELSMTLETRYDKPLHRSGRRNQVQDLPDYRKLSTSVVFWRKNQHPCCLRNVDYNSHQFPPRHHN